MRYFLVITDAGTYRYDTVAQAIRCTGTVHHVLLSVTPASVKTLGEMPEGAH